MSCINNRYASLNFTQHQRTVTNILFGILISSIVLTILAAYGYVPRVVGAISEIALEISIPVFICWMIHSCNSADNRYAAGNLVPDHPENRPPQNDGAGVRGTVARTGQSGNSQNRFPGQAHRLS